MGKKFKKGKIQKEFNSTFNSPSPKRKPVCRPEGLSHLLKRVLRRDPCHRKPSIVTSHKRLQTPIMRIFFELQGRGRRVGLTGGFTALRFPKNHLPIQVNWYTSGIYRIHETRERVMIYKIYRR